MSGESFNEKVNKIVNRITIFVVCFFGIGVVYGLVDKDTRSEIVQDYYDSNPEKAAQKKYEETKHEGNAMDEEEFKSLCKNVSGSDSYRNLIRNSDSLKGTKVCADLKIENTNLGETAMGMSFSGNMVVGITCSNPSMNIWLGDRFAFNDERRAGPKLLVGDVVRVYGYFSGTEVFATTGGGNVEAPVLDIRYIDFYGQ